MHSRSVLNSAAIARCTVVKLSCVSAISESSCDAMRVENKIFFTRRNKLRMRFFENIFYDTDQHGPERMKSDAKITVNDLTELRKINSGDFNNGNATTI